MRKRKGLLGFIDDNYRILTVIGIFLALAAYFSSQLVTGNTLYDSTIPVLSVAIATLLFVELFKQFPSKLDIVLKSFKTLLFFLILLVVGATLYKHPDMVKFTFDGILPFAIGISPLFIPSLDRPLEAFIKKRSLFTSILSLGLIWSLGKAVENTKPEGPANMFWLGVLLALFAILWTSFLAFSEKLGMSLAKKRFRKQYL